MSQLPKFIGPYRVIKKIGEGGMGSVYLVESSGTGQVFAAKVLKYSMGSSQMNVRFRREFRALKAVDHPSVLKVMEFGSEGSLQYFVMEFVGGQTFKHLIAQNTFDSAWIRRILELMIQICDALEYLHNRKMVHRDLKPSNIMITMENAKETAKLLDFGLVRWDEATSSLTKSQVIMGSLLYMAPEQAVGQLVDYRADIYSLGVILYESLTQRPPFTARHPMALISQHQATDPTSPHQLNPRIPPALSELILVMLAKNPAQRPPSAGIIRDKITAVLTGGSLDTEVSIQTRLIAEPQFTGRAEILESIRQLAAGSEWGSVKVLGITGETGIGKTRLIRQIECMLDLIPLSLPRALCQEGHSPGTPIIEALRMAVHQACLRGVGTATREQLADLMDQLNRAWEFSENRSDLDNGLTELATLIRRILLLLFFGQAPILILDDFHRASTGDVEWLEQLILEMRVRASGGPGLLIILAYRDDIIWERSQLRKALLGWQERDLLVTMELPALTEKEIRGLAVSMTGLVDDSYPWETVFKESEGNPLFAVEIIQELHSLRIQGLMSDHYPDLKLKRVSRIIDVRMNRLDAAELQLVRMGAVLGRRFSGTEHERLCDLPENEYLDAFDQLLNRHLFKDSPPFPDFYEFRHGKLREHAIRSMSSQRLRALHRKVAKLICALPGTPPQRVAFHLENASKYDDARPYRWACFDHAEQMGAQHEALNELTRIEKGLSVSEFSVKDLAFEKMRLNYEVGRMSRRVGDLVKAKHSLLLAGQQAEDLGERKFQGKVALQMGAVYGIRGDAEEAEESLQRALDIFRNLEDGQLEVDCLTNLGGALSAVSRDRDALFYHEKALKLAKTFDDLVRVSRCYLNIGYSNIALEDHTEALKAFYRSLEIARDLKNKRVIGFNLIGISAMYIGEGLTKETAEKACKMTQEACQVLKETGDRAKLADASFQYCRAAQYLGRDYAGYLQMAYKTAAELGITWLVKDIESWQALHL